MNMITALYFLAFAVVVNVVVLTVIATLLVIGLFANDIGSIRRRGGPRERLRPLNREH